MKKIFIAGLCITASLAGFAQGGKVITAYNLYTAYQQSNNTDRKSLEEAYTAINEATKNENTQGENKTWYYKAFICQLIISDTVLSPKYPNALFEAEEGYEKVITLSEAPDGKKKFVDEAYNNLTLVAGQFHNQGLAMLKANNNEAAYKSFKESLAVNDFMIKRNQQARMKMKFDNTRFLAAYTASRTKNYDDAKAYYAQLITDKYNNIGIYRELANIYGNEKKSDKALEVLQQGVKAYPDSVSLQIDVINVYLQSDRQTEAMDIMNKALQLDPKNASLWFVRGTTFTKLKDNEKAMADYQKAIEVDPKYADAYTNLASIYLEKANALVDKMAAPKITDAEFKKLETEKIGYQKQALPFLEKAADLKPNALDVLDALKSIYAKLGDYDKSAEIKKKMAKVQQDKAAGK